jgi:hypothetical protein
MIRLVQNLLLVAATSLLIIGGIDLSARAIGVALLISAAAYAIHRGLPAVWWIFSGLLVCSFCVSMREFFRAPQALMLLMCSMLSTLTIALMASWWWRQREQFKNGRSGTSR